MGPKGRSSSFFLPSAPRTRQLIGGGGRRILPYL
jgi:hypothetical protein